MSAIRFKAKPASIAIVNQFQATAERSFVVIISQQRCFMNHSDDFFLPSIDDASAKPPVEEEPAANDFYFYQLWRNLVRDRKASRLAAALSYRSIFSLAPLAILSIVIVRGVVHVDDAKDWMGRAVYESDVWKSFAHYSPDAGVGSFAKSIDDLIVQTWELNLIDLGVAGGLLLIWAAFSLFGEIEHAFNDILGVQRGRSRMRRLAVYWTFVTLGPILLFGALYGAGQTMDWLAAHPSLAYVADFAAAWFMLFLLYKFVPNASIRFLALLVGSAVAAVLWVVAKWGFEIYVTMAMPYSKLYGSLALIPLFLFWLYSVWWIVLFGLEVTAFRQTRLEKMRRSKL